MADRFRYLTPPAVKQMAVGSTIRENGVIVEKLVGDERWCVEFMFLRQRIHRVLGLSSEGCTRTKCVERIGQIKADIQYGQNALPVGRKTHPTVEQIAQRYLGRMEEGGGKNLVAKRRQLRDKLIPALGKERADTLSEQRVNGYKKRRLVEGAQPGTVNRELATLKHMLRDAAQAKDIPVMPCRITMLDEPEGRIVVISEAQERVLLQAAIEDHDPHLWLFIQFGLNTAMRHSEMLSARFDQIDWTLNTLFVPKAKAGSRQQPLTRTLVEILRAEREHRDDKDGFVFPTLMPGLSLTGHRSHLNRPFERCVERAGVGPAHITPHVMRHTAITRLVEEGVPLPTIQKISGHKTLAMVLRYTHVSGKHVADAMAKLERTVPEPLAADENNTGTTTTQELHRAG